MNLGKLWNHCSIFAGIIGGAAAKLLGGWDALLFSILLLMGMDYLTGLLKGIYQKQLSSEVGWKGICKKVMMLVVIACSQVLQHALGEEVPFREMVITFFIANEGLSILENAAVMIPLPQRLKETLLQIREMTDWDTSCGEERIFTESTEEEPWQE